MLNWLQSSVGRKQLIGLTGIGLSLFVFVHMVGNLLIMVSAEKYNMYSHALVSSELLPLAEGGLIVMFVGHILFALRISWSNYRARDHRYAMRPSGPKRTTLTQRSLWAQGLLILVFTILHLITFKYGTEYRVTYGQIEMRDLHRLVIEVFKQPGYVAWYAFALVVLFFHLSHGVGSSFQTMGLNHPRYNYAIKCFSWIYAAVVGLGFLSQPIYVYFLRG